MPVPEYQTSYEVSDFGRLRRMTWYTGVLRNVPKIIRPHKKATGYYDYWLWSDGKKKRTNAHRLVWSCFVGPIPEGMQINHKNGVKSDNRLANLELMTPSENAAHTYKFLGRKAPNYPSPGEKNGSAKLTEENVREIRTLYAAGGHTHKTLGNIYGVTDVNIGLIIRREKWKHVL